MINNINEVEIIIPILNEQKNITLICEQIIKLDWKNTKIFIHFIDDGSIDNSWKLIKELSGKYNQVNGTRLSRNFGKDCAILAGIQKCSTSHALIMDGDLQHPVQTIIKLINKMNDTKCDIVSANKINYEQSFFRSIYYYIFELLTKINLKNNSDFKLINIKVINFLKNMNEKNFFFRGMLEWSGFKQTTVNFEVSERIYGKSKYHFFSLLNIAFNSIFSYSTIPLRFITILGLMLLTVSVILLLRTIYLKIFSSLFDGYASLMVLILVFLSFVIISVGIIGEYLAKIYSEVKSRPTFVIYETTKK